jgi:hypothetical protein
VAADVGSRRRLLAAAAGAASLVALAVAAPGGTATLHGSIQGRDIDLRLESGERVTTLEAGTYTFVVRDDERLHNFHVLGTDVLTPVDEAVGVFTFADVPLAAGDYVYRCDVHPDVFGTFGVNRPAPPTTAPAVIVRVRAVTSRGRRAVILVLEVERRASATAHLRRAGRKWGGVRQTVEPGRRTLRIVVPSRARAGLYYLRITFREGGRTFVRTRAVRIQR